MVHESRSQELAHDGRAAAEADVQALGSRTGHLEGLVQYRYIWTKNDPEPSARIVREGDLRAALPKETPRVSPEERRRTIAQRQAHVAWRERP